MGRIVQNGNRSGKGAELTVEKPILVCTFQCCEKPIMSMEEMSKVSE